jgi:hypothetical protein
MMKYDAMGVSQGMRVFFFLILVEALNMPGPDHPNYFHQHQQSYVGI